MPLPDRRNTSFDPDRPGLVHRASPDDLRTPPRFERPGLIVFETRTVAGRVADACDEPGLAYLIAEPMEAWGGRRLKRHTTGGAR